MRVLAEYGWSMDSLEFHSQSCWVIPSVTLMELVSRYALSPNLF